MPRHLTILSPMPPQPCLPHGRAPWRRRLATAIPAFLLGAVGFAEHSAAAQSGNTPGDAVDFGAFTTAVKASGRVDTTDPVDFYAFEITGTPQEFTAVIPRATMTSYLRLAILRDANQDETIEDSEILDLSQGYNGVDASTYLWLSPGNYLARVAALPGYETPYQLSLSIKAHPESAGAGDDTLALADQRPPLPPARAVSDFVGNPDRVDFYRFEVTNTVHEFHAVIPRTTMDSYLNLALIQDANGDQTVEDSEILAAMQGYNGVTAELSHWLSPGTYYLRVAALSSYNTRYQLTYSLEPKPLSGGHEDDTLTLANRRATLQPARPVSDFVGAADAVDLYPFDVVGSVQAVQGIIPRSTLGGYLNLALIRDDNEDETIEASEILDSSQGYSGTDARVDAWLDPGHYYFRVTALAGYSTPYSLTLGQVAKPDSAGRRDNTPADAVPLGYLTTPRNILDYVGAADLDDFFRFEVAGPARKVTLLLPKESLSGYATLRLLTDADRNGILEEVKSVNGYNGTDAKIEATLGPGSYYVRVQQYPGYSTPYQLTLSRVFGTAEPPFVIEPPAETSVTSGDSATLTVLADGSGTLRYEWLLDNQVVAGATGPTLTLSGAIAEVRDYSVQVRITGSAGTITTAPVRLQVTPAAVTMASERSLLLSWPRVGTDGYLLQAADSPSGPWVFLTNRPVMDAGNRREVAIRELDRKGFYRLAKP